MVEQMTQFIRRLLVMVGTLIGIYMSICIFLHAYRMTSKAKYYYRFVDQDMFMCFWGGGIDHKAT